MMQFASVEIHSNQLEAWNQENGLKEAQLSEASPG